MFDAIAPRYDLLNHLLSAGIDRRWRERAITSLSLADAERLLDVCTGTADVALEARRQHPRTRIVGVDFAGAMLEIGVRKVRAAGHREGIALVRGDAMRLPVADGSVDAVTMAFGIRNVQHAETACGELVRVLRPRGRIAILEFSVPRVPGLASLYLWYFRRVLPFLGRAISGHGAAYSYLPASVATFPPPAELAAMLVRAGFADVRAVPLTLGIVYLYLGRKA